MSMLWRRAVMAISLPFATLSAAFLWLQAAKLQELGAHDYASAYVALGMCNASWAVLAICWLIWNPSRQEWFGAAATDDAEVDA